MAIEKFVGVLLLVASCARATDLDVDFGFDTEDRDYEIQTYNVIDKEGEICMTVALAANITVPYMIMVNASQSEPSLASFPLPSPNSSLVSDSTCANQTSGGSGHLVVRFGSMLTQIFLMDITVQGLGDKASWTVSALQLIVDSNDTMYFNESAATGVEMFNSSAVDLPKSNTAGYSCARTETLKLFGDTATGSMTYNNLRINPFSSKTFTDCAAKPSKKVSRIVPIAVGAALAFLLLLVLVAYIVNRATTKRRGYEKV